MPQQKTAEEKKAEAVALKKSFDERFVSQPYLFGRKTTPLINGSSKPQKKRGKRLPAETAEDASRKKPKKELSASFSCAIARRPAARC
jgi:hypothetical protein